MEAGGSETVRWGEMVVAQIRGGGENGQILEYVLKVEPMGFVTGLDGGVRGREEPRKRSVCLARVTGWVKCH